MQNKSNQITNGEGAGVNMTEKRNSLKKWICLSGYGKYTLFFASIHSICSLKFPQFLQNKYIS
jgi:hypothetical protein